MNDFTKEELEILSQSTSAWISDFSNYPDKLLIIRDKIQSMIDNYCEHKEYAQNEHYIKKCSRCGKVWR